MSYPAPGFLRTLLALWLLSLSPGVLAEPPVQVIVTFADRGVKRGDFGNPLDAYHAAGEYGASRWGHRIAGALARDHGLTLAVEWPIEALGIHCVVYSLAATHALDAVLAALRADQRVDSVQRMQTFHTLAADPYRPLQSSLGFLRADAAHRVTTGRSVEIAMIDAGADTTHADLAGQILEAQDLVDPARPSPMDEAHGTAVAGVIAARADNGIGIVGIAPDARLRVYRACWSEHAEARDARCTTLTLARALDAVLKRRPRILNMSLGGPPDPLLHALLERVIASGTLVVAAVPPGEVSAAGFPAGVPGVFAVRSLSRADTALGQGLAAPGDGILTTIPHDTYDFVSGSSFAAAHVSGVLALLMQLRPGLTRQEAGEALGGHDAPFTIGSADDTTPGRRGVEACAAIRALAIGVTCPTEEAFGHLSADPRLDTMPRTTLAARSVTALAPTGSESTVPH